MNNEKYEYDVITVFVDHLMKHIHLAALKMTDTAIDVAQTFIKEIF